MSLHVVIRADGGPRIGYGHLVRSRALAEVFLDQGHRVTCATTTPNNVRDVYPAGVNVYSLTSETERTIFPEWIKAKEPEVVLTDSYEIDLEYQRSIRGETSCLGVIMDETRHEVCADVLVNGNLYVSSLEYEYQTPEPNWCLGPDYLPLRKEISNLAQRPVQLCDPPERAIITMGGSDVAGLSPMVLRSFEGMSLRVDVILGPGFSKRQAEEIYSVARELSTDIQVLRDPNDLPNRMYQADIGVSTASTTIYEFLALGTPIVCLPVVNNQNPIARVLNERDLATVLIRKADISAFRRAIEDYMADRELRRDRSERGQELVDGRGADRVATEVVGFATESAKSGETFEG